MLETIAWVVLLMGLGGAIVVGIGIAIFMLSEDK